MHQCGGSGQDGCGDDFFECGKCNGKGITDLDGNAVDD